MAKGPPSRDRWTTMPATSTDQTESTRGDVGQGLYSLAELRAYLTLSGERGDGEQVERWLADVLNPVRRQPRRPDHSFSDLVSLFVVRELRRHGVQPRTIREAELYLRKRWNTDRPFVSDRIQTDGHDVYVDGNRITGQLEQASKRTGQQVMLDVVRDFLKDVRYHDGQAQLWIPAPRVVLDPAVRFGEPVVAGTRVPTSAVADVARARDVETAAERFRISSDQAVAALAFERLLAAARN
jgi:uncharacterized protein (DUF433 family)